MAAPAILGSTKDYQPTGGYVAPMLPSGVQAGDLLLAWVHSDKIANAFDIFDVWNDNGWKNLGQKIDSGGAEGAVGQVFWKIATGSEPAAIAFVRLTGGTGEMGAILMQIRPVTDTPINVYATAGNQNNQGVTPAVTTTVDECLIIRAISWNNDVALVNPPADTVPVQFNDGNSNSGHVAYEGKMEAGSVSAKSYSLSANTQTATITVAIQPEPPATPMTNTFEAQALVYKTDRQYFSTQAKIGVKIDPYSDQAEVSAQAFIEKEVREQFTAQAFILSLTGFEEIASQHLRKITQSFTMDWNLDGEYTDESDNVLVLEVERQLNEPLGGISQAMADVTLENSDNRYTPNYEDEE